MSRAAAVKKILEKTIKSSGPLKHEAANAEEFTKIVDQVRANPNPMYSANITPYTAEDYSKFKTYLSPDKKSGYAVKPDGELISVFSLEKGRGESILDDAVLEKGAQKLDAFDINKKLPTLYGKYMDETERLKFADEYAPKDWKYDQLGRPDVVMMKLNPEKVKKAQAGQQQVAQVPAKPGTLKSELSPTPSPSNKSVTEIAKNLGGKALDALGKPQQVMLDKVAQMLGQQGGVEDSEESSRQIVDAVAQKVGLPEDSEILTPLLKSLGVAGLEVFADPLGAAGQLTKLQKAGKMGAQALKKMKPVRATEDINIVKKAEDTIVGRRGLAEKAQIEQAKQAKAAERAARPVPPEVEAAANAKVQSVYGPELAAAQGNPQALKDLDRRIEIFKRIFINSNRGN